MSRLFAEVSVQQALECLAVSGLVACHLVDGVVDSVQVGGFGSLGQIGLAGGSAVLGYRYFKPIFKRMCAI